MYSKLLTDDRVRSHPAADLLLQVQPLIGRTLCHRLADRLAVSRTSLLYWIEHGLVRARFRRLMLHRFTLMLSP